jgi:hypothetical protein
MTANALIEKFKERLLKMKGLEKLYFLVVERDKLDKGIFSQSDWRGSEYKEELLKMLDNGDIADNLLERYFDSYKDNWDKARCKFFDSTDTIEYQEFLKSFKDYLPQDIIDSIKKTKDTKIKGLKLASSKKIFSNYYELRNWLNKEIQDQLDNNKLTDREVEMMIGSIKNKYEWNGTAVELVEILEELESKKWLHNPIGSSKGKAQLLLSCFTIMGTKDSVEYVTKIYKGPLLNNKPYYTIQERT